MLDKLIFGKKDQGLVFYRFGMRSRVYPIDMAKAASLRSATIVTLFITGLMIGGGISYAVMLTFIIGISSNSAMHGPGFQGVFGFDMHWLYLADLVQLALIGVVIFVYDLVVGNILRRP